MLKVFRGLGIGNLISRNKALLCKWWRRRRSNSEKDALWFKVLGSKYSMHYARQSLGCWFGCSNFLSELEI